MCFRALQTLLCRRVQRQKIVIRTQVLMVPTIENVTLHTVIAVVILELSYSSLREKLPWMR
jgi:hypothetical protein